MSQLLLYLCLLSRRGNPTTDGKGNPTFGKRNPTFISPNPYSYSEYFKFSSNSFLLIPRWKVVVRVQPLSSCSPEVRRDGRAPRQGGLLTFSPHTTDTTITHHGWQRPIRQPWRSRGRHPTQNNTPACCWIKKQGEIHPDPAAARGDGKKATRYNTPSSTRLRRGSRERFLAASVRRHRSVAAVLARQRGLASAPAKGQPRKMGRVWLPRSCPHRL